MVTLLKGKQIVRKWEVQQVEKYISIYILDLRLIIKNWLWEKKKIFFPAFPLILSILFISFFFLMSSTLYLFLNIYTFFSVIISFHLLSLSFPFILISSFTFFPIISIWLFEYFFFFFSDIYYISFYFLFFSVNIFTYIYLSNFFSLFHEF